MNTSSLCCVLAAILIGVPAICAADKPSSNLHQHPAVLQAALAPAETVRGQIVSVNPESSLVVVKNSQGTTFDFVVTETTRIQAAGKRVFQLKDLKDGRKYTCFGHVHT